MKTALLLNLALLATLFLNSCDSPPQSYDPHPQQNVKSTATPRPMASDPRAASVPGSTVQ